jgi:hypothetical protein
VEEPIESMATNEASALVPQPDGTPLRPHEWVVRVSSPTLDGSVNEAAFNLSSSDKKGTPPGLSVYAAGITTHEQAWRLTGGNPNNSKIYELNVDGIRVIKSAESSVSPSFLDVEWEVSYLTNSDHEYIKNEKGEKVRDSREGAEGHCGIRNMLGSSSQRARIRRELASIVRESDLPNDLLTSVMPKSDTV